MVAKPPCAQRGTGGGVGGRVPGTTVGGAVEAAIGITGGGGVAGGTVVEGAGVTARAAPEVVEEGLKVLVTTLPLTTVLVGGAAVLLPVIFVLGGAVLPGVVVLGGGV